MAVMWQFVWVWISELAQTRLLEKKEEKTKFWGWLVESVVKKKTVIESTFDYWILRLNMNIASFILWMDYWINKRNHFSLNEFNSLLATRMLDLLFYLFFKGFLSHKIASSAICARPVSSRLGYGKKELTYTPYNDGLIGLIQSGE